MIFHALVETAVKILDSQRLVAEQSTLLF